MKEDIARQQVDKLPLKLRFPIHSNIARKQHRV